MKVFNLTDVETEELKGRGLCNVSLVVGKYIVNPGESLDLGDSSLAAQVEGYVKVGAMAVNNPPAAYTASKSISAAMAAPPQALEVSKKKKRKKG